jgi:hypothetical protein
MLTEPHQHIGELADRRNLKSRNTKTKIARFSKLSRINLNTSSYIDFIDWQQNITEPLNLKTIPDENIQLLNEQKGDICLLRLPCHTQAVGRAVKTVKKLQSLCAVNPIKKSFIKAQIESRK